MKTRIVQIETETIHSAKMSKHFAIQYKHWYFPFWRYEIDVREGGAWSISIWGTLKGVQEYRDRMVRNHRNKRPKIINIIIDKTSK